MSKAYFRRILPDPEKIQAMKSLGFLAHRLGDPMIWHLNRRSTSLAAFIGLFFACLPMPMQMIPAAFFAVVCRANLPLSIVGVWVTNPLTMLPMMFAAYQMGAVMLGHPLATLNDVGLLMQVLWLEVLNLLGWYIAPSQWPVTTLSFWPLLLGSVLLGLILGGIGYAVVRGLWRWQAVRQWQRRATLRALGRPPEDSDDSDLKLS